MDQIQHSYLDIGGLTLHLAEIGSGELQNLSPLSLSLSLSIWQRHLGEAGTVVFLHGFPEIWFSWRHQMIALARAGFRAMAPDFRGYGLSQQPDEPENASWSDLISDLLVILDHFSLSKIFLAAKDFGGMVAYQFALLHPNRLSAIITLGIPFIYNDITIETLPEGFYILRWALPGRAEADFGRFDIKTIVRRIYILFSGSELPIAEEDQEIMDLVDQSSPLPSWFSEEDLTCYSELYQNSGFRFPLQIPYRKMKSLDIVENPRVQVPALLVMGEKDYVIKFPGMENYLKSGAVKNYVPDLEIEFMPEGSHFVQEQFPEQVNELILNFLKKFSS